jgi:hypothetical protein
MFYWLSNNNQTDQRKEKLKKILKNLINEEFGALEIIFLKFLMLRNCINNQTDQRDETEGLEMEVEVGEGEIGATCSCIIEILDFKRSCTCNFAGFSQYITNIA